MARHLRRIASDRHHGRPGFGHGVCCRRRTPVDVVALRRIDALEHPSVRGTEPQQQLLADRRRSCGRQHGGRNHTRGCRRPRGLDDDTFLGSRLNRSSRSARIVCRRGGPARGDRPRANTSNSHTAGQRELDPDVSRVGLRRRISVPSSVSESRRSSPQPSFMSWSWRWSSSARFHWRWVSEQSSGWFVERRSSPPGRSTRPTGYECCINPSTICVHDPGRVRLSRLLWQAPSDCR